MRTLWFVLGMILLFAIIRLYISARKEAYKEPPEGTIIVQLEEKEEDLINN
jgi:hypothetical protein